MTIHSITISTTGSAIPVSATEFAAKWVQFVAPSGNSGNVLIGGAEVTSSVGFPMVAGSSQFLPPIAEGAVQYNLSQLMCYLPSGQTLQVLYAV